MTEKEFEEYLNELGFPNDDHLEDVGRVSWKSVNKYGTWLRRRDPVSFNVAKREHES